MAPNFGAFPARLVPGTSLAAVLLNLTLLNLIFPGPALAQPPVAQSLMAQPLVAQAAPATPPAVVPALSVTAALQRAFSAPSARPEWFSREFAPVLPKLQEILSEYRVRLGAFQRVQAIQAGTGQAETGTYRLIYQRGVVTAAATVNAAGVFSGLRIVGETGLAADPATVRALERLYSGPVQPQWFSPEFLAQVPAQQLQTVLTQLSAGLGAFRGVTFDVGYLLNFAGGRVPVNSVATDAQGRFTGLLLGQAQSAATYSSFPQVTAALKALPGQKSLLVTRIAGQKWTDVAALDPDAKLAVGSSFKLAVLAELQAQILAGKWRWDSLITLQDADRSLPSGTLQNDPSGSQYTVQKLAEAMISVSDNTATDLLLRAVGRSGVEARLGEAPMLSTRELFALKNPANSALLARYRAATTVQARRTVILQAASAPLPTGAVLTLALDAEWHVSARRLCTLMNSVAALPLTSLNPGVADPADFSRVSYKGGGDNGVLNLTTQVMTRKGETYCVSVSWNDTREVSLSQLAPLVQATLQLLK